LSAHQASQEPTAARLRFPSRGFGFAPQFGERVADLGVDDVGQGAVRVEPIGEAVEHACVGAQGVRVALDLRGVEESVDGSTCGRPAVRVGNAPSGPRLGHRRRHHRTLSSSTYRITCTSRTPDDEAFALVADPRLDHSTG
jgi:hypothetical protein